MLFNHFGQIERYLRLFFEFWIQNILEFGTQSQARLLLLTAKNDALELQAQNVEQERLLLAQEQETIAQEYSDKTTNTI